MSKKFWTFDHYVALQFISYPHHNLMYKSLFLEEIMLLCL